MTNCEDCMNYYYDEEYDCYTCDVELDEDEMQMFMTKSYKACPYYRRGDEYTIVKKQM